MTKTILQANHIWCIVHLDEHFDSLPGFVTDNVIALHFEIIIFLVYPVCGIPVAEMLFYAQSKYNTLSNIKIPFATSGMNKIVTK